MDDHACQHFFLHPTQTLHRQYEALRAVFVARQPLLQVAHQFGYAYGSLRNLVSAFRAQCGAGQAPPFSPTRSPDGRTDLIPSHRLVGRSYQRRRTADNAL